MAAPLRLIIGLGNPGPSYDRTRHNIGFEVIDALSERINEPFKQKGQSLFAKGAWRGRPVGLVKPQTFMNRSGTAVEDLVRKNGLSPQDIMVIVDDIHLATGVIRIRGEGGTGGHNGLEDIADWLDSNKFPRMRIGVGNNFGSGQQANYVLETFSDDERPLMDKAVEKARDACLAFVTDGLMTAMNRYNG
ncbi:MAG: aminoacyl-tRNA hydrolase [Bacteroidetes bacterium]|nr:aminoacyl-tRNA hydrolase [Bacteroidota bacterium]